MLCLKMLKIIFNLVWKLPIRIKSASQIRTIIKLFSSTKLLFLQIVIICGNIFNLLNKMLYLHKYYYIGHHFVDNHGQCCYDIKFNKSFSIVNSYWSTLQHHTPRYLIIVHIARSFPIPPRDEYIWGQLLV